MRKLSQDPVLAGGRDWAPQYDNAALVVGLTRRRNSKMAMCQIMLPDETYGF